MFVNKGVLQKDGTIYCNKCKSVFPETHFMKRVSNIAVKYYCYKDDEKSKQRAWKSKLKNFFKITEEVYNTMLNNQQHCCAICNKHNSDFKRTLCIDHNHTTNEIRGLLCTICNNGIGLLKKDVLLINEAIRYLNKEKLLFIKDVINKKYTTKEPEYYSDRCIKRRYGINYQDYLNILKNQGDCCAICKLPKEQYHKNFAIDHCHNSGDVRGILCNNCNVGIACFNDNPNILLKAIDYIAKYNF